MNKKTKQILIFIAGLIIGYILNIKPEPSWESKQLILTPRNGIVSPQANILLNPEIIEDEIIKLETQEQEQQTINVNIEIIRRLESSNGTKGLAITCKNKGLSNEYGYNPPQCYESHSKLTSIVNDWFAKRSDWSLVNKLCYYNTGYKLDDCEYYQNYLKLKGGETK